MPVFDHREVITLSSQNRQGPNIFSRVNDIVKIDRNPSSPMTKLNQTRTTPISEDNGVSQQHQNPIIEDNKHDDSYFHPQEANYLAEVMKQRRRFDYTTLDFLYGTFC